MTKEVNLIKSESWIRSTIDEQNDILNETIKDFIEDDERIINIQAIEENGQTRFWIYTTKT